MLSSSCALWNLPSRPFLWAWPGAVGWEHHGPSWPSSSSRRGWQGGDHRPDKRAMVSTATPASPRWRTTAGVHTFLPHLRFNLHDSLLRQRARLNHGDSLSGEASKHFLMKTDMRSCSNEPVMTFRTLTYCSLGSALAAVVVDEGKHFLLTEKAEPETEPKSKFKPICTPKWCHEWLRKKPHPPGSPQTTRWSFSRHTC